MVKKNRGSTASLLGAIRRGQGASKAMDGRRGGMVRSRE